MMIENASGAVVYYRQDGQPQYLLLKSATSEFWGFPKGHVEAGEDWVTTAVREIREETGLTVTVQTDFTATIDYDMANGHHKHVEMYRAELPASPHPQVTRQVEEIADVAWLPYVAARERLTFDNLKAVLDQANTCLTEGQF